MVHEVLCQGLLQAKLIWQNKLMNWYPPAYKKLEHNMFEYVSFIIVLKIV
jgi:hypothetical protein